MKLKQIAKIATLSKKEIKESSKNYVAKILEEKTPEEVLFESVRFEEFFKQINTDLKSHLKENSTYNGAQCTEQSRTSLDYSIDAIWSDLKAQISKREELLKARAKLGKVIFDENGEEVTLCPSSTTSFFKIEL